MENSTAIGNWTILYTPQNAQLLELVNGASEQLGLDPAEAAASPEELARRLVNDRHLVGLNFHIDDMVDIPAHLEYSVRLPSELRTGQFNPAINNWRTDLLFPRFEILGPRNRLSDNGGIPPGYFQEGFLAIQNAIANQFLQMKSNMAESMPEIHIQRYPYPPYIRDVLLTGLETLVSLIILLSFVFPFTNTVKFIAIEKEKQLKEWMKIMGLPNWLHWSSWFVRPLVSEHKYVGIYSQRLVMCVAVPIRFLVSYCSDYSFELNVKHFLIDSMATTTFSFMLSVFFSKANTASAVSGLVWFIFYSAYTFTIVAYDNLEVYEKMLLSLLSNTAMAFGFQIIIRLEGTSEGLQWNNFWRPVSVDDNISIGLIMVMLLVCTVLYLLIALYFEKVLPGQYGVPQPWYFPFTKRFWCGQSSWDYTDENYSNENPDYFEEDPPNHNCGIKAMNLRKLYTRKKVGVEGFSINMFDDQITVLLGHNGAGKTTTMSMLTGMIRPTSGSAIINGKDIRRDIDGVRASLGLCPQHNILFDELTVKEHIIFFSRLKGLNGKEVQEEVEKYVNLINLRPKMNSLSKTLSGGMKRKLCVCIALCGRSKVVLLDEPTSGMDPASRRALWDVLREEKQGRTLLLSTHFMDEADILGDRIAIMSNGVLKCVGSSHFLKKKFGNGYHLICVKKPTCNSERITNLLQRYISDVQVDGDIGTELSYQLPEERSKVFHEMFSELENRCIELGIDSYGISLTTLEEVFMKVGSDPSRATHDPIGIHGNDNLLDIENSAYGSKEILNYAEEIPLLTGGRLLMNQIIVLFKKKILVDMRNWFLLLIQMAIPVLFICITVVTQRALGWFQDLPRLKIWLQSYLRTVTVLQTNQTDDASLVGKFVREYENQLEVNNDNSFLKIYEDFEEFIIRISEEFLVRVSSKYLVGATITNADQITAWFNNQPFHAAPLSVSLAHNAVIRAHLGTDHGITVYNEPLPYSVDSRITFLHSGGTMGFQIAVNTGFAMAFVASFYVVSYIKERMVRSKLLQFVSGANVLTFWLTAYLWDMLTFLVTVVLMIIAFGIFQEDGWSTPAELSRVLLILFAFIFAILPVTFFASKFFKESADGFSILSLIYIITGIACYFVVFIMSMEEYDLEDVAKSLTWIFLLFPHFALSHGLSNINMVTIFNQICDTQCNLLHPFCDNMETLCRLEQFFNITAPCCHNDYFDFDNYGIGRHLLYLFVVGVIVFVVLLLNEYGLVAAVFYKIRNCFVKFTLEPSTEPVDSDVQEEKDKVLNMSRFEIESYNLVVDNMSKAYDKFVAVNSMCIAVEQSECFGLLGINGAGKTSAFKMLTGDETITQGEAWIRGLSLKNEMYKIRKIIGYCPQFDALLVDMTGRETLELFCSLRGIPKHRIKSISLQLAADLNFLVHIDKKVKGMDPGAKRQLWDMVSKVRSTGKSIVLTSHLMDECEALCTRLAIMVNGEFKCLGSVQHLKNKFSKGFSLTIKIKKDISRNTETNEFLGSFHLSSPTSLEQTLVDVKNFVKEKFIGAELKEEFMGLLTYFIPKSDLKWSTMFRLMEEAKSMFHIEDYSLSQTSLEQVFLSFANQQKEEKIEQP
ncbi:Phospholipid-transporting ATPase ABCA3, partial [Pseudolycoriella hygida]